MRHFWKKVGGGKVRGPFPVACLLPRRRRARKVRSYRLRGDLLDGVLQDAVTQARTHKAVAAQEKG